MKIRVSLFLNTELLLVTCCAWLKNYGNTTQKQRGILRMWKPAILNSYLGEEGTTVSATVHHTGAERQKDRGHRQREREVAVGRLFLFGGKRGLSSGTRTPTTCNSSAISKWFEALIVNHRRSAIFQSSVAVVSPPASVVIFGGKGCYGGETAVLRSGLHQESLPGRQPAQRPSPPDYVEGRGTLFTLSKLL